VTPARVIAVVALEAGLLFGLGATAGAPAHWWRSTGAAAGRHHVATISAIVDNGTLLVWFNLEDFVVAEKAWTFAHDDGRARLQVRSDDGAWVDRAATSGGEGALRVAGFGPVKPASVAVRVVHNGVASSPRLVENYD